MPDHLVAQGECLTSIADQYGFFWQTLWAHPRNASLNASGRHPNMLFPGDVVHIPEKTPKEYACETGARHRFKRRGVPAKLRLRLLWDDEPRTGEAYSLDIDGALRSGSVGSDGIVEVRIPSAAKRGVLIVGEGERRMTYQLALGHVDPIDEISGVKARLKNLGFTCGGADSHLDEQTQEALRAFQGSRGLEPTGEIDGATLAELRAAHDAL